MSTKIEQILKTEEDLKRGILYLFSFQTEAEQQTEETIEQNGVGFNGVDAPFMTSIANQISWGRGLSPKQVQACWRIIAKYHGQLASRAWEQVTLPEVQDPVQAKKRKEHPLKAQYPDKAGYLTLADDYKKRMRFIPFVYPSKQIKSVGFRSWDGEAWNQTVGTINMTVLNDVQKLFGEIAIDPEVLEIANPKLEELPAEVREHGSLFDFQKQAIQFALSAKHGMIALAPGLGKTATAIFAASAVQADKVLVVCPKSLLFNWKNEIKKWGGEHQTVSIIHGKNMLLPTRWTVTNYDTLRLNPDRFNRKWDVIIVDESIMVKNRKAQRTQSVKDLVNKSKAEHVWFLSGAPVTRLLDDMWAQLNILDPARFSSYWRFAERYCVVTQDQWGWHILSNQPDGATRIKQDIKDIYFARTQDQVLDLPDWIMDTLEVPMSEEQDRLYRDMEAKFRAELSEGDVLTADNILAQMTRLIQLASNPALVGGKDVTAKGQALLELLEFEQGPFIVWTSFVETAKWVQEKLNKTYRVGVLTGAVPAEARQKIVDDFQAGKLDVIVAHPAVGKFGYTLTKARTAIYLERQWFADDYIQSLHRVRRIGTEHSPHIIHLLATRAEKAGGAGTVDHVIDKILQSRKETNLKLTAGDLQHLFGEVSDEHE